MNRRVIWREALLDLRSGTTRAGILAALFGFALFVLSWQDSQAVIGLLQQAERFQSADANVRIVASPGRIDGAACEQLNRYPGVTAAAIREGHDYLRAATASSAPIPIVSTTASAPLLLNSTPTSEHTNGGFLGPEAAELLPHGVNTLTAATGDVPIAGTYAYPNDGRRGGLAYALVQPTLDYSQPFDECWLRSWPEIAQPNSLLATTVDERTPTDSDGGGEITTEYTQLNSSLGQDFHGEQQFQSRPSSWNHLFAAAIGLVIGLFAYWPRRLSIATSLHLGASRIDILRIHLIQHSAWILTGALSAILLSTLCAAPSGFFTDVWPILVLAPCFGAIGALTASGCVLALFNPMLLLRLVQTRQ